MTRFLAFARDVGEKVCTWWVSVKRDKQRLQIREFTEEVEMMRFQWLSTLSIHISSFPYD
jgi:hypothetical protein